EAGAPFHVLGYYDGDAEEVRFGIKIPKLLSILADHDPNATIAGLNAVPADDRPTNRAINIVRFSFQAMIAIGTGLLLLGAWLLLTWWRLGWLTRSKWFFRAVCVAAPLTVVALISGWVTTEVGRQPWVVYGYMRTADAVTDAYGLPV